MSGRFLVIRGGAIGDFILTLPVFAALRANFPKSAIEVLAYPKVAQLAKLGGLVEDYRPIESRALACFFAESGRLDMALGDYFAKFDVIISYLYDPDKIFRTNIDRVSAAQYIQGIHRPDETKLEPASKALLQALEVLAVFDADPVPRLPLSGPERQSNLLAIHPGSGSESKNWPETKWAFVLERLAQATQCELLVISGEAEGKGVEQLVKRFPENRVRHMHNQSLVEVARALAGARYFLGHDSGITHLAGALGVPGSVLWSNTVEAVWRPLNPQMEIVRGGGGIKSIPVEPILETLKKIFP